MFKFIKMKLVIVIIGILLTFTTASSFAKYTTIGKVTLTNKFGKTLEFLNQQNTAEYLQIKGLNSKHFSLANNASITATVRAKNPKEQCNKSVRDPENLIIPMIVYPQGESTTGECHAYFGIVLLCPSNSNENYMLAISGYTGHNIAYTAQGNYTKHAGVIFTTPPN